MESSAGLLRICGNPGGNGGLGNSDEDLGEQSPLSLPHSLEDSGASLGFEGDELCPHNCPWHTRAVPVPRGTGAG